MRSFYVNKDNFVFTKIGILLNLKISLKDKIITYNRKEYRELYIICYDYFDPMGICEECLVHVNNVMLFFQGNLLLTKIAEKILFSVTKEIEEFYA